MVAQHQLGHQDLLVDAADHDLLVHRLILPPDKVAVEIHIQVVQGLHVGQGLIHKNVVHVEGVLGQLQPALPQKLRPVDHGVHEDVLPQHKVLHIAPGDQLADRKGLLVVHHLFSPGALFLVDEVAHQKIQGRLPLHEGAQGIQDLHVGLLIDPVVAVHHLEIDSGGVSQAGVHRLPVSAVFLVDRPADARIIPLVFVRDLPGSVLGGAVVHDEDLHLLPPRQQALYTMTHIVFRIIAGNCHRQ